MHQVTYKSDEKWHSGGFYFCQKEQSKNNRYCKNSFGESLAEQRN